MSDEKITAPTDPSYFRAAEAARLVGMSLSRLRRYERAGLLTPALHVSGARLYGQAQLTHLRRIRRLRDELEVNLAGIEIILRLLDEIEQRTAVLEGTTSHERQ